MNVWTVAVAVGGFLLAVFGPTWGYLVGFVAIVSALVVRDVLHQRRIDRMRTEFEHWAETHNS